VNLESDCSLTSWHQAGQISLVMGVVVAETECSMQTLKSSCFGFSLRSPQNMHLVTVMSKVLNRSKQKWTTSLNKQIVPDWNFSKDSDLKSWTLASR